MRYVAVGSGLGHFPKLEFSPVSAFSSPLPLLLCLKTTTLFLAANATMWSNGWKVTDLTMAEEDVQGSSSFPSPSPTHSASCSYLCKAAFLRKDRTDAKVVFFPTCKPRLPCPCSRRAWCRPWVHSVLSLKVQIRPRTKFS